MCGLANMQILRLRPPTGRLLPGTRRPAVTSWDFSVLRNFVLSESSGPPSPGQFSNFTDTPVFASPNTAVSNRNFGRVSSQSNAPRQIQIGLKLLW